jgi:hypothetical protein
VLNPDVDNKIKGFFSEGFRKLLDFLIYFVGNVHINILPHDDEPDSGQSLLLVSER